MSEPIKAGDLVYISGACKHCGDIEGLGEIFRVQEICICHGDKSCCGNSESEWCGIREADGLGVPIDELKRIPPLGELDDVKRDEEITA